MTVMYVLKELRLYLGLPLSSPSLKDLLSATLTALVATLCLVQLSKLILATVYAGIPLSYNAYVLTSIAASSVLVFAVPHGALSQPWPVIGGHFFSALVGVLCAKYLGTELLLAAALAVSLSILLMSFLRCVHPPGGATALGAVLGGEAIQDLGFTYLLTPTLLNCVIIIVAATIINYPFVWRRYPAHLYFKKSPAGKVSPGDRENEITIEDFLKAINDHDSYIDITDEGWMEIFENAKRHAEFDSEHPSRIDTGMAYSNGKLGNKWEIRRVALILNKYRLEFVILAGVNAGLSGVCSINEFKQWAKFKVEQDQAGVWARSNIH